MSVVEFMFRKAREVLKFSKDRLRLLVPLGIWKIYTTYISHTFSETWDQNTLHWLSEKRYCSIVLIAAVHNVLAEDCNTRLHETLST